MKGAIVIRSLGTGEPAMSLEFKEWAFTEAEEKKFSDWMARIMVGHTGTKDMRNPQVN
jgi:hypothetical protein